MNSKRHIKYLSAFILASLALIYVVAQKNGEFFKKSPVANKEFAETNNEVDEIGVPTDDDPWLEMDNLVAAYYNTQGVLFKGTVKLIDDNEEKEKIIEEHPFEYEVLDDNSYYRLGNMEVVNKRDLILVADHSNKFISIAPVLPTASGKQKKLFDIGEFKKLMEERKANAKVTQLGDQKILTIDNIEDPQVQGYQIYYDPATYQISKMLIGMQRLTSLGGEEEAGIEVIPDPSEEKEINENDNEAENEDPGIETYVYYLEIIYSEMKVLNIEEDAFNPENKFIRIINNKIELMPAYGGYQLTGNIKPEN